MTKDEILKIAEQHRKCGPETGWCLKSDCQIFRALLEVSDELKDYKQLHHRTIALVFPGERDSPGAYMKILRDAEARVKELERDLSEEQRLNAMGASRELKLMTKLKETERKLKISREALEKCRIYSACEEEIEMIVSQALKTVGGEDGR